MSALKRLSLLAVLAATAIADYQKVVNLDGIPDRLWIDRKGHLEEIESTTKTAVSQSGWQLTITGQTQELVEGAEGYINDLKRRSKCSREVLIEELPYPVIIGQHARHLKQIESDTEAIIVTPDKAVADPGSGPVTVLVYGATDQVVNAAILRMEERINRYQISSVINIDKTYEDAIRGKKGHQHPLEVIESQTKTRIFYNPNSDSSISTFNVRIWGTESTIPEARRRIEELINPGASQPAERLTTASDFSFEQVVTGSYRIEEARRHEEDKAIEEARRLEADKIANERRLREDEVKKLHEDGRKRDSWEDMA